MNETCSKPTEIFRYGPPNKMDIAPFGSTCIVVVADMAHIYTQYSHDEENPAWELTRIENNKNIC